MNTQQKYYLDHPQENTPTRTPRKQTEKAKALQLLGTGLTQKQIAAKLGVTEKTVGKWAKEWKREKQDNADTLQLFNNRLTALLKDPKAKPSDIKNLVAAMNNAKNLYS